MFQKAISQGVLHTHMFDLLCIPWFRALFTQNLLALGDSNHLSDGTPSKKRTSIKPQIKKRKMKKKMEKSEKKKKKKKTNVIKMLVNRISGII